VLAPIRKAKASIFTLELRTMHMKLHGHIRWEAFYFEDLLLKKMVGKDTKDSRLP
jgi:hypothetical protein